MRHTERVPNHQRKPPKISSCRLTSTVSGISKYCSMLAPRLSRIVLMVRGTQGIEKSLAFYHGAIGLPLVRATDDWAELGLGDAHAATLCLQAVEQESQLGTGYSPIMTIEVADMDTVVSNCVQSGGHLDGPIQYPAHGKVAALRAPDGHMIGLYEPNYK